MQFGGAGLPSASTSTNDNADVFVVSYTAAGTYRWAQAGGGTGDDVSNGLAVDGSGNVYATGYVTNLATSATDLTTSPNFRVQFGNTGLASASTGINSNQDVFVASYTAAGTYRWAQAGGGTGNDVGNGVAVDGSGNVYVTGYVTTAATSATDRTSSPTFRVQFGGAGLPSASTGITSNLDVFVASYTAAGAYRWAQAGGGVSDDIGYGVAVDGSGNVYATGNVFNAATSATDRTSNPAVRVQFGGAGLPSASTNTNNSQDVFVASYTAAGTYRWAQPGGGASSDVGSGVAVDGSGNVYATGSVGNAATSATDRTSGPGYRVQFGNTGLPSVSTATSGNFDVFVASYTAAGAYRWARAGGGAGQDSGYGVAVAGSTVAVATATGTTVTRFGNLAAPLSAAVLGQLATADGAWLRADAPLQSSSSSSISQARATAVDGSGNVYVTGSFVNQVAFGNTVLNSAGGTDVFVAKWDATARAWAWAQAGGGTNNDVGYGLTLDGSGNVYVTGSVTNAATGAADLTSGPGVRVQFGGAGLPSASTNTTANQDVFVASYTAAGTYRWAQAGGGAGADVGNGVAVDGSGNVYLTGVVANAATSATDRTSGSAFRVQFGSTGLPSASTNTVSNNDVFVASYSSAGVYRWAQAGGGAGGDIGYGLAVDGSGNVYATGYVVNAATSATDRASGPTVRVEFGSTSLPSASTTTTANQDVFVVSYTAAGTYRWATAGGGTTTDVGNGVAVDASGNVYLTGSVANAATSATDLTSGPTLRVQFGNTGLPSASTNPSANTDVFVASYTAAGVYRWAQAGGGASSDAGNGVAVAGSGTVYVTGSVSNAATSATDRTSGSAVRVQFGNTGLPSASTNTASNNDVFVASYTAAGVYRWAQAAGGTGLDIGLGLAVDGSGTVNVAGQVAPVATFGSQAVATPVGIASMFVARLAPPAPTLTGVSPAAELPGQVVTLTGMDFTSTSTVSFGGVAAAGVTFVSATSLTAVVPVGAGTTVGVSTPAGTSAPQPFALLAVAAGSTLPVGACTPATPATPGPDSNWHYLLVGGQVALAYNTQGLDLGTVSAELLRADPAQPVRQDGRRRAYLGRNWHLNASAGLFPGSSVLVRFYALTSEYDQLQAADPAGVPTPAALRLTQYSGPNEDCDLANSTGPDRRLLAPTTTAGPTGSDFLVSEASVPDHFSEFYLSGGTAPLPVALTQFTATAQGPRAVRLAWATASEKNSAAFEVERSADGHTFAAIGTVAAAGSSSTPRSYALLDPTPPTHRPTIYYRLKQVDADGTFCYSPVRTVAGNEPAATRLALYPNPARAAAAVTVAGLPAGTPATVFDTLNRPVATATADATGTAQLVLPAGLASGMYILKSGTQAQRLTVE